MALVGINPTDYKPGKRSALDSIAVGAQIANSVLGAAASAGGLYSELWGPKAELYGSEIIKNKAAARIEGMKVKQDLEQQFAKEDTVQAVNNLDDVYLTAKAFAEMPKIDKAAGLQLTTKYLQSMFPKAGIRMNQEQTGLTADTMTPAIKQLTEKWNGLFNTPDGLTPQVVKGMMKSIETTRSSMLPKYDYIVKFYSDKARNEYGIPDFNPLRIPGPLDMAKPQAAQSASSAMPQDQPAGTDNATLNSLRMKLRKPQPVGR